MNLGKKSGFRGALTLVLIVSVALHVVALAVFGVVRLAQEVMREPPAFEAPPIEMRPEEVPPPPVDLQQRTQASSPPRPNPITVQAEQDMDLPALDIDVNVESTSAYGRGAGGFGGTGGGSTIREMALELEFFGANATGSNVVFVLDCTLSGAGVFARTREELLKTLGQMRSMGAGQFGIVYFGGSRAGHVVGRMEVDPTASDYWFPTGIREREWIDPSSEAAERTIAELRAVDPRNLDLRFESWKDVKNWEGSFFVRGTQYWGAINAAFRMNPAPDTVFFLVEANVAFPSVERVEMSYEWFEKHGRRKPPATVVHFVMGNNRKDVKDMPALRRMVDLVNGGTLTEEEIDALITFTQ